MGIKNSEYFKQEISKKKQRRKNCLTIFSILAIASIVVILLCVIPLDLTEDIRWLFINKFGIPLFTLLVLQIAQIVNFFVYKYTDNSCIDDMFRVLLGKKEKNKEYQKIEKEKIQIKINKELAYSNSINQAIKELIKEDKQLKDDVYFYVKDMEDDIKKLIKILDNEEKSR